ncbi:homoserine kinase [soil metagenome]
MAVKTRFSQHDFEQILAQYDLGTYIQAEGVQQGSVQTNFFIQTTQGKFVFRYYENRAKEAVRFESHLLEYLKTQHYPSPAPFKNAQGDYVSLYHNKPYMILDFRDGQHIEHPSAIHNQQLIQKVAELQKLTQDYHSPYTAYRWNYSPELCRTLARAEATKLHTKDAEEKFIWLSEQLAALQLPPTLPKGICHCDFHFSNVLFQGDEFVALLDFDDANYTFLTFDLVGLIETWAWPYAAERLDLKQARPVVQEYGKHRPLAAIEQQHLYDVYKLSILIDCVWYFGRGQANDFYEKRKIAALSSLGRQLFFDALFQD